MTSPKHSPDDSGYAETKPTQPMTDNTRPQPKKPGGEHDQVEKKAAGTTTPEREDPPALPGQEPIREPTPAGDNVPGPIKEPERS
jgi:hypothetical protein